MSTQWLQYLFLFVTKLYAYNNHISCFSLCCTGQRFAEETLLGPHIILVNRSAWECMTINKYHSMERTVQALLSLCVTFIPDYLTLYLSFYIYPVCMCLCMNVFYFLFLSSNRGYIRSCHAQFVTFWWINMFKTDRNS